MYMKGGWGVGGGNSPLEFTRHYVAETDELCNKYANFSRLSSQANQNPSTGHRLGMIAAHDTRTTSSILYSTVSMRYFKSRYRFANVKGHNGGGLMLPPLQQIRLMHRRADRFS